MSDALPVTSVTDVTATLPDAVRQPATAPVRDAIADANYAMFAAYQGSAAYAAAQSNPEFATGIYLRGLAADHAVFAGQAETDDELRARVFAFQQTVSPSAILAAVNAITAPFTTVLSQLVESELDCAFLPRNNSSSFDCFIGNSPHYPDRLYPDDSVENGGAVRPQNDPGGFLVFEDTFGRHFLLRVPQLDAATTAFTFVTTVDPDEMFISDNTNSHGSELSGAVISFVYVDNSTADELYSAIVGVTDRLRGQGIRFNVFVDPTLA